MIGLIGKKVGMTQVFDEAGVLTPVTVIHVEPNVVVNSRTIEKHGYSALIIGSWKLKKSNVIKPYAGQFKEGIEPTRFLLEMKDFDRECAVGEKIGVEMFNNVRFVDVVGTTKGKGYQGVMKLHGFSGGRDTHGSKFHRVNGSTGNNTTPGKVAKGRKMAGRMGADRMTVQNLRVVKVDSDNQIILVKGAVPGPQNCMVVVKKAKKKR